MSKLTREAIGRDCTIRLDGCGTGPCCLCHIRQIGISGMGIKAPDFMGAWGCANCHEIVDVSGRGDVEVQLRFREAVAETQYILHKEGKL
jgi:hypothetical protein